ncbi:MAG: glutamine amidotransferase [Phycisphaerae bacterium]
MQRIVLEFRGTDNVPLLIALLAGVVLIMLAWAGWQLLRHRIRYGLLSLASAGGLPLAVPALLIDASGCWLRGQRRRGRLSAAAAGGICLLPAGVFLVLGLLAWVSLLGQPISGSKAAIAFGAVVRAIASGSSGVWLLILAVQIALAVGVFYTSVYGHLGTSQMLRLLGLRTAAILVLLLILFKPALAVTSGDPAELPYLHILVDRSESMGTIDSDAQASRYQRAVDRLTQQQPRLRRHYRPIFHHFAEFDNQVETLDQLRQVGPESGQAGATDIATPMRNASVAHPAGMMGPIVLITDGIDNVNAPQGLNEAASQSIVPIWTVGAGSTDHNMGAGPAGLRIMDVDAPLEAIVGNTTQLEATLLLNGLARTAVKVSLLDEAGIELASQQIYNDQPTAVELAKLDWIPRRLGPEAPAGGALRKLTIRAEPLVPAVAEVAADEVQLHILLTQPRIRVVYIEGSIRPEYKFLHRLLKSDPNIQFMGLVRMTGSRFWAQGSLDGGKLDTFPTTEADFAAFDVLILGDLDASYLTRTQMGQIRRFVTEGGALLMLGGHNSFGPGGYGGTDIEAVLPVVLGQRGQDQEAAPLLPRLTPAGQVHPIFEGITGFFPGPGRKATAQPPLPALSGIVSTVRAKPGTALAVHPDRRNADGPLTVLAVQQAGAGRSAAFTADTTWKWFLPMRGLGAESPYDRFWGQLIRWLAGAQTQAHDAEPAAVARLKPTRSSFRIGQDFQMLLRVQDARGQRPETAAVTASFLPVETPETPSRRVPLAWQAGLRAYQADVSPLEEGRFEISFTAADGQNKLGQDRLPVRIEPHSAELETNARNDALLAELAARSRGQNWLLDGMDEMVDQLIQLQQETAPPGPQTTTARMYQFPVLFVLFCGLLTLEWLLRRRWQLQ